MRAITQFLLRDVLTAAAQRQAKAGTRGRFPGSWQTGLFYEDFRPKPAVATFPLTLLPFRDGGRTVRIFGHIRTDRTGGQAVRIEGLASDGSWKTIETSNTSGGDRHPGFLTDPGGVFIRQIGSAGAPAWYRFAIDGGDGKVTYSVPQPLQQLDRAPPK